MISRIAILGVGLIGGSLGLVWKRRRPTLRITGFDDAGVLERARDAGAIDAGATTAAEAVRGADLVVLATPLAAMPDLLDEIAPVVDAGAIVTDVGSVKAPIGAHAAKVLPPAVDFVGGHPMAGSEHGGIQHADALLFENATYVLCPDDAAEAAFLDRHADLVQLVELTGARLLLLDARRHDEIAAMVSHLPQLVAVALMKLAADAGTTDPAVLQLAAGGFRDMTRIASSPFGMWRDIVMANHGTILDALAAFGSEIQRLRNRIIEEDVEALEEHFTVARQARESIPRDTKGFLIPLSDVYVYAVDRPGELFRIIQTVYGAGLNVKDIELLKVREGTGGAFRLGFARAAEARAAVTALEDAGFSAYRLN